MTEQKKTLAEIAEEITTTAKKINNLIVAGFEEVEKIYK